jgi:hypothetical protein
VAVVAIALVVFLVMQRKRRRLEMAREEYGSEYQRVAEERGSEEQAEKELRERRGTVEDRVRPLPEESRERYDEEWRANVEQTFINDPAASLDGADRVIERVLVERNFPTGSREEAGDGLGAMYPGVAEDFREAQRIHKEGTSREGSGADLEQMRRAIQKYRSVYERLTED